MKRLSGFCRTPLHLAVTILAALARPRVAGIGELSGSCRTTARHAPRRSMRAPELSKCCPLFVQHLPKGYLGSRGSAPLRPAPTESRHLLANICQTLTRLGRIWWMFSNLGPHLGWPNWASMWATFCVASQTLPNVGPNWPRLSKLWCHLARVWPKLTSIRQLMAQLGRIRDEPRLS